MLLMNDRGIVLIVIKKVWYVYNKCCNLFNKLFLFCWFFFFIIFSKIYFLCGFFIKINYKFIDMFFFLNGIWWGWCIIMFIFVLLIWYIYSKMYVYVFFIIIGIIIL